MSRAPHPTKENTGPVLPSRIALREGRPYQDSGLLRTYARTLTSGPELASSLFRLLGALGMGVRTRVGVSGRRGMWNEERGTEDRDRNRVRVDGAPLDLLLVRSSWLIVGFVCEQGSGCPEDLGCGTEDMDRVNRALSELVLVQASWATLGIGYGSAMTLPTGTNDHTAS
ncbi:hypothetical protein BDZ94DRAFT_1242162 [Collybia nuda]|uniref:Uncharacterized protein n=1 Tax=Collybia nuda TaxID=64659 RepID=A0A9P5XS53_9AGAR|nr:hypothetical protein BDZ94DRAFT_1242162 [Collybia nuda]